MKRIFFILTTLLFIAISCNNNEYKVSEKGLIYRFEKENKNNPQPATGDVVTLNMRYAAPDNSIIEDYDVFRIQLKKPSHPGGCIEDAIAMMHKGDSAIFMINANDYYKKTRKIPLPDGLSVSDRLTFYVKLIDITPYEEFVKEREMAKLSDEIEEEKLLKDYLKRTNITSEPTMSGLYFIELRKGTGKSPVPGKKVTVNYMGYFIDGKIFDSSYERNEPFTFKYGTGEVIQGWDEGLAKMKTGGKYKLIIPSHLAYGDVQRGPIPPNSTLIFEIELLDAEQ
jgi:FKBP-type peptidyl-prolyl cis-trans isomerase